MPVTLNARGLQDLPTELLLEITFLAGNFSLFHVSRRFHDFILDDRTRFCFSTSVFYRGNPYTFLAKDNRQCSDAQTALLAQQWFSWIFSARVEAEVRRMQFADYQNDVAKMEISDRATAAKTWMPVGIGRVNCAIGTTLPRDLFEEPCRDSGLRLLCRLVRWNVKARSRDHEAFYGKLITAVGDGRREVAKLLSEKLPGLDCDLVRSAWASPQLIAKYRHRPLQA